jgi:predicted lipase
VDVAEVLGYARRSSAVYGDEAAIRAVIGPVKELTVADLPGVDVRAFVAVDEARGVQWVAVRGTANLKNVAEDAEYAKVEALDLGIPVHEGFVIDARAVWSFARPLLRPGLETRVTGHSLGGALAVLLAMRLRVDGQPLGRVITFGQPKVTTELGVARFRDLPLLRVVNHDDPVPLLPWETPGAAVGGLYRHLGEELRLSDRGTFELLPEHRAEGYLLTSFLARLGRENPQEHEIARYLGRLETLVGPRGSVGGQP